MTEEATGNLRSLLGFYKTYRSNNFGDRYIETMDYEIGFGRKMKNDVMLFQKYNKLVQDGIVGPKTKAKLIAFCKKEYGNSGAKTIELNKDITVFEGQKVSLSENNTQFYINRVFGNSCEAQREISGNQDTMCAEIYSPVAEVSAIIGGDAVTGGVIIAPGSSAEVAGYKFNVVSINQAQPETTDRTIVIRIEKA
jgi:hypothetical protein